ncbi:hypothetical protein BHM03_00060698 [Ensete ventricosum]|nr:hypothetical protein BHM03_00060698 [Ensete ventricosum]
MARLPVGAAGYGQGLLQGWSSVASPLPSRGQVVKGATCKAVALVGIGSAHRGGTLRGVTYGNNAHSPAGGVA